MARYQTPLRYPGGKQRLAPFIEEIIACNRLIGGHYVEPYAGGAGVAIELLLENRVNHIHLNDSSTHIFTFWSCALNYTDELCGRIRNASLTIDEWKRQREILRHPDKHSHIDIGFSVFYLNRCNRSGVLSGGVIGGLNQTGNYKMDARFSRNDLIRRIELIASRKSSITLHNLDAEQYIQQHIPTLPNNTLVYLDPPYYTKSSRLYLNHYKPEDHIRIANTVQEKLQHRWVVSYDGVQPIIEQYSNRRQFVYQLQYNAAEVYKGTEIFIFSDNLTIPRNSTISYINQAINKNSDSLFTH